MQRCHGDARHGDDRRVTFDRLQARADPIAAGEQDRVFGEVIGAV